MGGESQAKRSDFPKIKPHRPTAAGRLSDVASGAWRGRRQGEVSESALALPIRGLLSDVI